MQHGARQQTRKLERPLEPVWADGGKETLRLTSNQKKILDFIWSKQQSEFVATFEEILEETEIKPGSLRTTLSRLEKKGFFDKVTKKGSVYFSVHRAARETQNTKLKNNFNTQLRAVKKNTNTIVSPETQKRLKVFAEAKKHKLKTRTQNKKHKILQRAGLVFGLGLSCVLTTFLVFEGHKFFKSICDFNPWLLSFSLEAMLVFFASYNFHGLGSRILAKIMLVAVFVFSVGSYSYFSIDEGLTKYNEANKSQSLSNQVSRQITEKENLIAKYQKSGWIGEVRALSREKQMLTKKLFSLTDSGHSDPKLILILMGLTLVFRFLVQVSNLLVFHEITKRPVD